MAVVSLELDTLKLIPNSSQTAASVKPSSLARLIASRLNSGLYLL